ncbi:hypothetical protein OG301_39095 (plasmid) [Streptomyces platensis]|uniref:hypothetical protein n=1 Tax=Streptomyces platensis TaxID=58346 RepID=UPI002ED1D2C3|nr:hypothetical protein OG301_39095 [Streptomyces platensis]
MGSIFAGRGPGREGVNGAHTPNLAIVAVHVQTRDERDQMAAHTPRKTLPPWAEVDPGTREHLAAQVPCRLQRVMYGSEVGDPDPGHFAAAVVEADRRLRALCADRPDVGELFGDLTFAGVAFEDDRMLAAEREYYLCDALIQYGNAHFGGVWSLPVFDPEWLGMYPAT